MKMMGLDYGQYYNYCYRRTGTLWEGRYKATLIDAEAYLLTCMRYSESNPVRTDMDHRSVRLSGQVIILTYWDKLMIE
jgi:putative transposase